MKYGELKREVYQEITWSKAQSNHRSFATTVIIMQKAGIMQHVPHSMKSVTRCNPSWSLKCRKLQWPGQNSCSKQRGGSDQPNSKTVDPGGSCWKISQHQYWDPDTREPYADWIQIEPETPWRIVRNLRTLKAAIPTKPYTDGPRLTATRLRCNCFFVQEHLGHYLSSSRSSYCRWWLPTHNIAADLSIVCR